MRVHYGPPHKNLFWKVKCKNATKDVTIKGKQLHALNGKAGFTIGCHISNCAMDEENKKAFDPHRVLIASVSKSRLVIVTDIEGDSAHGVLYEHDYGKFVDMNDNKKDNKYIQAHPDFFERDFRFKAPRRRTKDTRGTHEKKAGPARKAVVPLGALRRAVKAGLVSQPVAEALENT